MHMMPGNAAVTLDLVTGCQTEALRSQQKYDSDTASVNLPVRLHSFYCPTMTAATGFEMYYLNTCTEQITVLHHNAATPN